MAKRFSLLIVEEDRDCRGFLGGILEREGYRVFGVPSGLEALQVLRGEAIHGLIIDVKLPDLSGIEMLRRIRQERDFVPSILISSEPWKELQLEALDAGVFSFIQKPVREEILRVSVAKLLERFCSEGSLRLAIQRYEERPEQGGNEYGNENQDRRRH